MNNKTSPQTTKPKQPLPSSPNSPIYKGKKQIILFAVLASEENSEIQIDIYNVFDVINEPIVSSNK